MKKTNKQRTTKKQVVYTLNHSTATERKTGRVPERNLQNTEALAVRSLTVSAVVQFWVSSIFEYKVSVHKN